ncbi:NnrU family protein [Desulforhopalus sp. IMCC35007]|uniref:NnrU family protein n=1 Tax=Desulforhopalus sp. IMCC35007 TaxID=2569543 RepID=UPI0010AE29F4|nr:NnrU family protein [Desulforhopalus sp. IMCC35007]TKB06878.1 NnrU family protein [Desulforhopalus sp. IMCC35007]
MIIFLLGLFLFLGIHCISIVNDSWRNRIVEKVGGLPWKGVYALVSICGFALLVRGYAVVRYESALLYSPPQWLQYFSMLLFLPVFSLLIAAYFPGRIKTATKHPMLLATILWAGAHLLSNGSQVNVILFGSFLAWAVVDLVSIGRRQARPVPGAPYSHFNDIIACVFGLGLYVMFVFWLHEIFFGVALL